MLNTKLILVEGIPGTGKSTMAQFIAIQLEKNGKKVKWYHECLDDHFFWNHFDDLFDDDDLFKDQNCIEQFYQLNLKLWQELVETAQKEDAVFVIDGYFFASMSNLLFKSDQDETKIVELFQKVEEIIKPLNPLLVYYSAENVREHTIKTWDDRAAWAKESTIAMAEQMPFVIRSGLKGEDALVYYIEQIINLDSRISALTKVNKLNICITNRDYPAYRKQVLESIGIKYITDEFYVADKTKFCGFYDNDEENLTVKILDDELVCDWQLKNMVLLPIEQNVYNLRSFPINLKFIEDVDGKVTNIETFGSPFYNRVGCKFERVTESKYPPLE